MVEYRFKVEIDAETDQCRVYFYESDGSVLDIPADHIPVICGLMRHLARDLESGDVMGTMQ